MQSSSPQKPVTVVGTFNMTLLEFLGQLKAILPDDDAASRLALDASISATRTAEESKDRDLRRVPSREFYEGFKDHVAKAFESTDSFGAFVTGKLPELAAAKALPIAAYWADMDDETRQTCYAYVAKLMHMAEIISSVPEDKLAQMDAMLPQMMAMLSKALGGGAPGPAKQ